MGIGLTELTLAQLAAYRYQNVNFINLPGGSLLYTVAGSPNTIIINLGEFLNIAEGEVQGDAIAIDELTATQIGDNAIHGRELAATPGLFHTPTATVIHDHNDDAAGATLLAANAAGEGDRLVLVQCTVTEAFVTTSWGINVGSASAAGGLFTDIFDGVADLAIDETVVGAYLLPEGEALVTAEVDMTGDTQGILSFAVVVMTPAAGSIPGWLLADNAIGLFENVAAVNVADSEGPTKEILALDATNDRLCLIMGIATISAAGGPDFDIGSVTTAINAAFDDIAAGAWVKGERFMGACMLPAGENLIATIGAGTGGAIDFYVIPITVVAGGAAASNAFVGTTDAVQDHGTGAGTLLAANNPGEGDRLLIVQAECTVAFAGTEWEWDIGSAASGNGLFDDIFGGAVPLAIGRSVVGTYLLPEGEALALTETLMTMTAGQVTFRIHIVAPAAGSIPGALLADDAIGLFEDITPTTVAFGGGATQQLLASDPNSNRHVLVMAIATVTSETGVSDWDVGAGAGNEVFDDIADGDWIAGERFMGACDLAAGDALNVTLTTAGSQGEIDFYVIALTPLVATANIEDAAVTGVKLAATPNLFETATTHDQHHDTGAGTILAANAVGEGDRLVVVQAECTEAFSDVTSWEWQVGSAADPNGLFADIFAGVVDLGVGETVMGVYLLPENEALALVETDMTVGGAPTGIIQFSYIVMTPAAGSIPGALLADDGVNFFDDITPTAVTFGGGATQQLLAQDATYDRLVLIAAIAQVAAEAGVCDWDVGAGAGLEAFDNIAGGNWIAGNRFMSAMMLPAGQDLNVTLQTAGSAGEIDFYCIPLTVVGAQSIDDGMLSSYIVKDPGRIAVGLVDFNATGDCTSVDVGATAVYTRHATTSDFPNGVWEDGANPGESATNLALAINGDTRNSGGPYYAAFKNVNTVYIMALAVGAAGNVNVVKTGGTDPDVQENLTGGADAAVKETVLIERVVTAEEAVQVEVIIPLPFDPIFFSFEIYDTNGGLYDPVITDRGTITNAAGTVPCYFKLLTNGATHVQAGDIIKLIVQE